MKDAVVTGFGKIEKKTIAIAVMDFNFLAATMGSVVGEKITRVIERATATKRPLIIVAASGGARMYEGMLSLMQMAKTSGALARPAEAELPYISVLTHPTTAGVMASFASLGDLIVAEPKCMVGFAGPRVIRETTHQDLPAGFQTAEFLLGHGFIDLIVRRSELRPTLSQLLDYLGRTKYVVSPSKKALDDTLSWLYGTQTRGIKLGLAGIQALADVLGNPQQSLRFVHVAGTNGKGSVCAMLESICRAAGLKTGLFTSPHLVRYNERIQVNRRSIPNEEVIRGINQIQALISEHDLNPSFFEITMALAFLYFLKSAVDIVVLETGLGGRLDATNIVMPIVSVLTSIDLDHQRILGNSLAEIAREKAGIIKQGVPVVSAPQYAEVCRVFESVAQSHSTQIQYAEFPSPPFRLALAGSRQQLNAAVAVDGLSQANLTISPTASTTGLGSPFSPRTLYPTESHP